jgi:hypothetical protein
MNSITISPAYGRDYRSKKDAESAFQQNQDFIVESIASGYAGSYCNRSDLKAGGIKQVEIRYLKKTRLTIVKL